MASIARAGAPVSPLLSRADQAAHERLGIDPALLAFARVRRVSDAEARALGLTGPGDLAGIVYPYLQPGTREPLTHRVRRDHPEMENGKPRRKYVAPFGDRRHVYLSAADAEHLDDADVPVVLVEAEKSALMLASVSRRTDRALVPVALGGCYGWRGRIGRAEGVDGERVDETGMLPDLVALVQPGRTFIVWLDGNVASNRLVERARRDLTRELATRGAVVRWASMPALPAAINGPDDYRAETNDAAVLSVLDRARAAEQPQSSVTLQRAIDIKPERIEWLWPGYLAANKTAMLVGHPGLGKSQLTCAMAAAVSTGGTWPDGTRAPLGDVLFISAEDDPEDTIVPRLLAAGADLSRVYILRAVEDRRDGETSTRGVNLRRDVPLLADALARLPGARLVILDPVTAYCGDADTRQQSDIRALLQPVEAMAQRQRCAVLLVSHMNKSASTDAMTRVSGSTAFVAAARFAYLVAADPNDDQLRMMVNIKTNLSAKPAGLAYRVEGATVAGDIPTSRIVWTGDTVTLTANEVLAAAAPDGEERTARQEAGDWLREALQDGPKQKKDLERLAKADGLAWRTVQYAAKAIGVQMRRAGFGAASMWALGDTVAPSDSQSRHALEMARLDEAGATGDPATVDRAATSGGESPGPEGGADVIA